MSLRIRRGTDAQRSILVFDQGEIVYTTDTKKIYVGDGVTAGGVNVLKNSAGVGVTFNDTTQAFDFSTANLGLSTSVVSEGTNKYFTTQRAQDAAASLFTSVGSPTSSGNVTGTIATGTVVISGSPTLAQGERFIVAGTGGGGLVAGTYYIVSVTLPNVVLASTLSNAMAGTAITYLTTASLTGTTFTAGGTDTGINFTYDSVNHVMNVTASGVTSLITDVSPSLGGNLTLNSRNITGTGNINITGTVTATGLNGPLTGNVLSATASTLLDSTAKTLTVDGITLSGASGIISGTQLAVGTTKSIFYTQSYSGSGSPWIAFTQSQSSNANSSAIAFTRSRGALATPTSVAGGDQIVSLIGSAYTGSAYSYVGGLTCTVTGTISSGNIASRWDITATDNAGTQYNQLAVGPGYVQFGSITTTQRNALTAVNGMVIYNSTVNRFQGYQGGGWIRLDTGAPD
jgi:hypothetical protein